MVQGWIQMNIPESAIRPFEPLGIPKIGIVPYASIIHALDDAFKTMNELGEEHDKAMQLEGIELFLMGCVKNMGALTSKVLVTQFCHDECDVDVYYTTKGSRTLHRYNGMVYSNSGFKHSDWFGAK